MKQRSLIPNLSFVALLCLTSSGCLNLQPTADPTRYFLLQPIAADDGARAEAQSGLAVGIHPVTVPSYLTKPWVVVRMSDTEIRYSDYAKWGEYMDKGIQRVLAENIAHLMHTDRIRVNSWIKGDVDVELKLTVRRFEVDEQGLVVLDAQWQTSGSQSSAGHRIVRASGPVPIKDPPGAAATMSTALNELSRVIAAELQLSEPDSNNQDEP